MKSCARRFEALEGQSWIPYKWQLLRPKLPVLAPGVSQLSPSFDLKSQAAHEKLCGALWSIERAVLDPLEVTAFAAKTACCTCPWSVTAVSKLWPKVASCLEKLCGAFWSVGRAVLDPLEVTALAAKTACTCPWSVTAVSKLWPKVASCLEKLCGALWSVGRAVLDPLEVTALAAKTACTCPWSVTAVSSQLCPSFDLKSPAAHEKLCGALWRVGTAVLDPLEVTASAAEPADDLSEPGYRDGRTGQCSTPSVIPGAALPWT